MATLLLQWLVLEYIAVIHHNSALTRCDNSPACSWATRMSPKSIIGAQLVRALAVRQRIRHASPMVTLHVAGKDNDIADIPSRSFWPEHRWNCPSNKEFLPRFALQFPLQKGKRWQLFLISHRIITRMISELLTAPGEMDGWCRLPVIRKAFGGTSASTSPLMLTPTLKEKASTPLLNGSPTLLDGYGKAISVENIECLVLESRLLSGPSTRPVSWIEGRSRCTAPPKSISNHLK